MCGLALFPLGDCFGIYIVALGERSYDILIGNNLLTQAGSLIERLRPGVKCSIVTDENVAGHHLAPLQTSLEKAGIENKAITLKPGEQTKSFDQLSSLVESLLEHKIERGDLVIALGGGVIGDLTGFAASILRYSGRQLLRKRSQGFLTAAACGCRDSRGTLVP